MSERYEQAAIVTGTSSGIGFELARCFAQDGYPVIAVAEDKAALAQAADKLRAEGSPRVETVDVDLSAPDGPQRLYDEVGRLGLVPHFLANNAGVGVEGDFVGETDLAAELRMIQLNAASVVALTKLFGHDMVDRHSGKILITSSIAALAPSPKLAVYSATKAFDFAFSEAIADELKDTGVTVTALLPSETDTNFFRRAGAEGTKLDQSSKADPAKVARAGYDAMMKGSDHVMAPFKAKMRAALTSVLPESVITSQARSD